MRVGEAVKVEDVQGTVELIGLRSTRIRTADRTLVTYPNGKLADLKIESIAARDRSRAVLSFSVQAVLRAARLRALREALLQRVQAHPLVVADRVRVHYTALSDTGLTVEVQAYFQTTDADKFLELRSDLILALVEVVEAHGATAAFVKPA
jgi:MscS family membrane protein